MDCRAGGAGASGGSFAGRSRSEIRVREPRCLSLATGVGRHGTKVSIFEILRDWRRHQYFGDLFHERMVWSRRRPHHVLRTHDLSKRARKILQLRWRPEDLVARPQMGAVDARDRWRGAYPAADDS